MAGDPDQDLSPRAREVLKMLQDARARRASEMPRPTGRDVGTHLAAYVEAATQGMWAPRGLDPRSGDALLPLPGSLARHPGKSNLNPENSFVTETISDRLHSVRNHLESLAILLREGAPLESILAVSRVTLEPSTHVAYLTMGTKERIRLARAFNLRQSALEEELADAEHWAFDQNDDSSHQDILAERTELYVAAQADGFHIATKKHRGRVRYRLEPIEPASEMRSAALGKELGEIAWRVLSSAAHSQPRSMLRVPLGIPGLPQGQHSEWMGLFWVYVSVEAAITAFEGASRYLGGSNPDIFHTERLRFVAQDAAWMITNQDERIKRAQRLFPKNTSR